MTKYGIACSLALLAGSFAVSASVEAQTVTVTPTDPAGWTFQETNPAGTIGITNSEPRSGNGSLETSTTDGTGRTRFGFGNPYDASAPTLANLDEVTALSFDWFRDALSTTSAWQAPVFRLHIWDGAQRSELIWEAVYNGYPVAGPGVPEGVWTNTELTSNLFYRYVTGSGVTLSGGGAQINQTVDDWASSSLYTSAARITGISIGAGSGWTKEFTGYADNVTFGANGKTPTTWNFEVAGSTSVTPEPVSMILLGTGLAGLAVLGRRKRKVAEVA